MEWGAEGVQATCTTCHGLIENGDKKALGQRAWERDLAKFRARHPGSDDSHITLEYVMENQEEDFWCYRESESN